MVTPRFVGVDVGTGSVRAGVFDAKGACEGTGTAPISIHRPKPDWAEQSSEGIWDAAGRAVREAVARVPADSVRGIAFDATCSLVLLGPGRRPLPLDAASPKWNVIVWMDHRATEEADRLSQSGAPALRYVGGTLSPEMEVPKLAWLRDRTPRVFDAIGKAQDLADHLVFRASGEDVRSVCTLGCKWGWLTKDREFDRALYRAAGIERVLQDARAGERVGDLGERAGSLLPDAAAHFSLSPGIAVGVGIIDAHAGGLGTLSGDALDEQIAIIAGTSACHMAVSKEACFVPGVWGPYLGAMVPGMWLSEGGQSAAGSLLDHLLSTGARASSLGADPHGALAAMLADAPPDATKGLHVLPYFHGNRSPRADPSARGAIHGLTLDDSTDALARTYLAAVQALAYGTRHIVETMNANGHRIRAAHICGGSAKNAIYVREHADVLGLPIRVVTEPDAMLLGTAMLAAVAAGESPSVAAAMAAMKAPGEIVRPRLDRRPVHDERYQVFLEMYADQKKYASITSR